MAVCQITLYAPMYKPSTPWPLEADPFLALEEIDEPAALSWVAEQNLRTRLAFADSADYALLYRRLLDAYQSPDRIVAPSRFGSWAYDFWQDDVHPLGIWRRASWSAWLGGTPVWETVLDIDALSATDGQTWVVRNLSLLYPDGDRALVILSPAGADSCVVREFDLLARGFVADGFVIEQPGKHVIGWIDRQSVYVGRDNGGATLTRSGYPREARCWRRGTALTDAPVVFSGATADISAGASYDPLDRRHSAWRSTGFFDTESYWRDDRSVWHRYDVPTHVAVSYWNGWLLFNPRLPWLNDGATVPPGALLAIREADFLAGARKAFTLFEPTQVSAFVGLDRTKNWLIVSCLKNVVTQTALHRAYRDPQGAWQWQVRTMPSRAGVEASVSAIAHEIDDLAFVYLSDYLNPDALFIVDLADPAAEGPIEPAAEGAAWRELARLPAQFNAGDLAIEMRSAVAPDGVRIPYTVIGRKTTLQGAGCPAPCLLYGYGGFEIALTPNYAVGPGIGWLERGGIYVVANIRGGGEFGPAWHQAAQGDKRQVAFDDFIAVAEALIADGITAAAQLAIQGGSNGGLLVAACMIQRPALFGAVVCEVPLLDMARYHQLLAGASWIDEYGDPEQPNHARALAAYSPYHNVKGVQGGTSYPPVLFLTSTRDDRVHPGHARKMTAKMQQLGHEQTWYLENVDGGHAGAVDARQNASRHALIYSFLWRTVGQRQAPEAHFIAT